MAQMNEKDLDNVAGGIQDTGDISAESFAGNAINQVTDNSVNIGNKIDRSIDESVKEVTDIDVNTTVKNSLF